MENKQTLEKAAIDQIAWKWLDIEENYESVEDTISFTKGVEVGANWQAERMYTEKEVMDLFKKYQYDLAQWVLRMEDDIAGKPIPTEWFEQFKKN